MTRRISDGDSYPHLLPSRLRTEFVDRTFPDRHPYGVFEPISVPPKLRATAPWTLKTMALDTISPPRRDPDAESFKHLYIEHHGSLCRFARRFVKSNQTAEDVVQDVFLRLWERWKYRRPKGEAAHYLYRAVRYGAIDVLRHQRVVDEWASQRLNAISVAPPNPFTGPYEGINRTELEVAVRNSLEALPDGRRNVFELSRSHGLTHAEIAEAMDLPVRRVERHVSLSLARLRSDLADHIN